MSEFYEEASEEIGNARTMAPCKRDYESEIKRYTDKLSDKRAALEGLESLLIKHGGTISSLAIKKLIGTAYVQTGEIQNVIDRLITEQEETNK